MSEKGVPFEYEGNKLLDGGIINPLPISNIKRNDDECLVVVNLNSNIEYTNKLVQNPNSTLDRFEKLIEPANFIYGEEIGSHYAEQRGPKLSKHFIS